MGTQGYLVYRYKGRYLNRFVQNSAYPDSVGVDIVCGIPVQREEFQRWLQAVRIKFEEEWARKVTEADKVFAYRLSTERLSNSPSALRVGSGQNWSSTSIHPPPAGFIVPREIEAVSDPGRLSKEARSLAASLIMNGLCPMPFYLNSKVSPSPVLQLPAMGRGGLTNRFCVRICTQLDD